MAPRRSAATEVMEEEVPQLATLQFNEPLSWRAGKAIATAELLRRLETLAAELRDMDQEETDKDSLTKVAKELVGQNLIGHKDKGVRAYTACCLVDVLKLCAPDAPYTQSQLRVCGPPQTEEQLADGSIGHLHSVRPNYSSRSFRSLGCI
jgi:sister-chromatid-cohesion protein PDS5